MIIAVTGGRPKNLPVWLDKKFVFETLDTFKRFNSINELIHGDAFGIDKFCAEWAFRNSIRAIPIPITQSMWREHGKRAGAIRNGQILNCKPDILLVFPGGPGTQNMYLQARQREIKILKINSLISPF